MLFRSYFTSKQPFRIVITNQAADILQQYSWPQNTREIQDLVENWVIHGHRLITPDILPIHIRNNITPEASLISEYHLDLVEEMGLKEFLATFKKEIIAEMTKRHDGVLKRASDAMGTSYTTLFEFMKKNNHKTLNTRRLQ